MLKENLNKKYLGFLLVGALLIIFYKLLANINIIWGAVGTFFSIISPFLFAILIVYFLYRPAVKIEELYKHSKLKFLVKRARVFSVLTVYLLLISLIAFFFTFLVPILVQSVLDFINNIPGFLDKIPNTWFGYNFDLVAQATTWWNSHYTTLFDPARLESVTQGVMSVGRGLFNFLLALIASLYMLIERDNILGFFRNASKSIFSEKTHNELVGYLRQINKVNFTFISSKGMDAIINFVVVTIILLILGVPYALLFGLIAGIGNMIPFIGSLIAVGLISVVTLLTGGFALALKTLIALTIFQQLDANFIEPKLMNTTLKISPLLVIISVIVGGAYFGIIGMFLAVPVTVIAKQLLLEYLNYRKDTKPVKVK